MVGTFYSRANPKSNPFVKVGDRVDTNTTVCIVEAMFYWPLEQIDREARRGEWRQGDSARGLWQMEGN